ncbi:MAG: FimV/HubP family polar landmark protein [Usitatibacter sp.]
MAIALLMGATFVAQAAGLGKLTVNSALGQILNAEIDLVSLQPGELDSLTARVASPEAFRDARVEYSPSLRLLRFAVDKRPNGQPYLKVTSVAPVNEPFVDVLIEVTWPAGRIQREYPILLDPPGYAQGKVAPPAITAAAPAPRATETPPAAAPAVAPSSSDTGAASGAGTPSASAEMHAVASVVPAPSATAGSDTYGPVQRGETLRKIAEQVKPSTVSMEQMLVSLYRENKAAFAGNNMNRLKTGQILKVPSADEVAQVEARDANREIRAHVADWKSYRETLAGGVASLPARPDSSIASSGRIGSAAVAPPPPAAAPSTDVLKLSRTDTGKGAPGKGGAGSQDRVNALQEEVTAKDKALKEAQSRVADLEKQIRDMQRLLDLKGAAPAKPADTKVAVAPVPAPAPAKVEPPKAEPPKVAEVKPAEPPKVATPTAAPVEAPKVEAPKPEEPKVAAAPPPAPEAATAPPKAAKKPAPPPKEWYEDIDPIYLALGGAAVIAIPLVFLFVRRRKQRAEAGPSSSMTSAFPSDLKPSTNTGKAGGGLVDTGNSSFLTDFDKTGPGTIDTDEVDPVAEAEVYIAYGRDAQAEEILKEAMARDKNRHEIALKLLEIYHARKSATAFETVAKELRAAVGDGSPLWQKAAAMGAQIDPSNPLYSAAGSGTATFTAMSPAAAAPAKPDLDFDLDGGANVSATEAHASAPAPDFDLDLDGDRKSGAQAPDLPVESSQSIDFDLAPPASAPSMDMPAEQPKEEKPAFDFDLSGLDFPSSKPAAAPAAAPAAPSSGSIDLADLSLDAPAESGGEAVGTKLELAKAYLEIGDKDGAREILKEVAKEGSSAQREEASKLIASL